MEQIVYLEDVKFEKESMWDCTPAGIKYNCKNCHTILFTKHYGSYAYCINCFNKYEKNKNKPPTPKYNIDEVAFLDDDEDELKEWTQNCIKDKLHQDKIDNMINHKKLKEKQYMVECIIANKLIKPKCKFDNDDIDFID